MRERSSVMPPRTGVTWPSSEVPAPQGTTGTRLVLHSASRRRGLLGGFDEGDGVGQHRRLGVLAVRVVFAQRGVGGDALAQEVAGGGDHGVGGLASAVSGVRAMPHRPAARAGKERAASIGLPSFGSA